MVSYALWLLLILIMVWCLWTISDGLILARPLSPLSFMTITSCPSVIVSFGHCFFSRKSDSRSTNVCQSVIKTPKQHHSTLPLPSLPPAPPSTISHTTHTITPNITQNITHPQHLTPTSHSTSHKTSNTHHHPHIRLLSFSACWLHKRCNKLDWNKFLRRPWQLVDLLDL